MVKSYLRFDLDSSFGVISSANIIFDPSEKQIIAGTLENVTVWNYRTKMILSTLKEFNKKSEITCLEISQDRSNLAVGHSDGTIRIWRIKEGVCRTTLTGHKSAISALRFSKDGLLLVSGSRDTDIVLWDVVSESGIVKLRGHRDMITDVKILENRNSKKILSCSKDGLLKVFDVETQHCQQTIVGHRHPIWSLDVDPDETRVITGSDKKLRIWKILDENEAVKREEEKSELTTHSNDENENNKDNEDNKETDDIGVDDVLRLHGTLQREFGERVSQLRYSPNGSLLAVQSPTNVLEIYKIFDEEEQETKLQKRKNKQQKKAKQASESQTQAQAKDNVVVPLISDEIEFQEALRLPDKLQSFSFSPNVEADHQIAVSLTNNSVHIYQMVMNKKSENQASSLDNITLQGHRTDVRSVSISSNDAMILTTSSSEIKIWNTKTRNCVRTFEGLDYALCGVFLPGNFHVVVGTKAGTLEIFDLGSATKLESIQAHSGAIWSIALNPNQRGLVSASADQSIHFWDFELAESKNSKDSKGVSKHVTLVRSRTLKQESEILSVKFSSNGKLIAFSLMDNTVKVHYVDTLKFFLSLYGHTLPVLSLDISTDSTMIVTASSDKNVKIWGLDFGDCRKSIFAHSDSIMNVLFVANTHYFFTSSKDKTIKQFDGDTFENIQTLTGHSGEVWALAISSHGDFLVSGSHDKSIRIWSETEEPLFLEEEKENQMDSMFESSLQEDDNRERENKDILPESAQASRKTMDVIKSGESLVEAIDLAVEQLNEEKGYKIALDKIMELRKIKVEEGKEEIPLPSAPKPSPYLLGRTPAQHVLKSLNDIRSSDLEEALSLMPFSSVLRFFDFMLIWLKDPTTSPRNIETICQSLFHLLKVHQNQISVFSSLSGVLLTLSTVAKTRIKEQREAIGFNLAAMSYLKREVETSSEAPLYDVAQKLEEARLKRKRRESKRGT